MFPEKASPQLNLQIGQVGLLGYNYGRMVQVNAIVRQTDT